MWAACHGVLAIGWWRSPSVPTFIGQASGLCWFHTSESAFRRAESGGARRQGRFVSERERKRLIPLADCGMLCTCDAPRRPAITDSFSV